MCVLVSFFCWSARRSSACAAAAAVASAAADEMCMRARTRGCNKIYRVHLAVVRRSRSRARVTQKAINIFVHAQLAPLELPNALRSGSGVCVLARTRKKTTHSHTNNTTRNTLTCAGVRACASEESAQPAAAASSAVYEVPGRRRRRRRWRHRLPPLSTQSSTVCSRRFQAIERG